MSGWKAKRFWKQASIEAEGAGWRVRLDGRPIRTPAKAALILPTRAMATAVAAEWDAQQGEVNPATMPVTRAANSAIDTVGPNFAQVADQIAAYGATDLLCYRADSPPALVARQADGWDPLLAWSAQHHGAPLRVTHGVVPVGQPPESLARLGLAVRSLDPFRLAALHDLVAISGSLVIGLAVMDGHLDVATGWDLSRIDERWQAELWGEDAEAAALEAYKRQAMQDAARFLTLCCAAETAAQ